MADPQNLPKAPATPYVHQADRVTEPRLDKSAVSTHLLDANLIPNALREKVVRPPGCT